tara:strand:- start:2441 stop:3472 length:1032 start_codon:yes stop_codon:yes gene_type:complete
MKILIVTSMYPSPEKKYSGIFVKNQYEQLQTLMKEGEEIELFYMKRTFTSFFGSIKKYVAAFFRFTPYFFKKFDVIHLHSFYPLIIVTWLYKIFYPKTKLVVTFHGTDVNQQVNSRNAKLMQFLSKKINFTIPVGKEVAKNVSEKLKLPIGKTLPVGVNSNIFYPEKDTDKIYDYLFVGSFIKRKGVDFLMKSIRDISPDIRFCIAGSGDDFQSSIEKLIKEGYSIELKGEQTHEELCALYNQSKFFVLPSRSEGFATVIIESMYCGTPVITSDIPQFIEQVNDQENGFTFPLDQPEKLTELLSNLINISTSEYQNMALCAQNSFKNISLNMVCDELMKIYRA